MRKKLLIFIVLMVGAFIAGIVFAPLLQEKTYHLKEWIKRPVSLPPVSKVVTLYFSTPEDELLVPVERKIIINDNRNINDQIRKIIQELIKGPQTSSFLSTLPPQTKLRAVYTREDVIYVDFSSSLIENHPGGTSAELVSIYSIVNTLLENFPSYSRVQILIEGKPHSTLAGHIDIRQPFRKNTKIIKTTE